MFLVRKAQLQGLRSRQKRSLLIVNEYFGGKRNDASGTLWTETKRRQNDFDEKAYSYCICYFPVS